jgi:hypothetical protein
MPPFLHQAIAMLLSGMLYLLPVGEASAGVDDCLKAAFNTADPDDLKKAAAFAYNHPSCLSNLLPPTLVPYAALSGSLDAANQSGALNQAGLGFSTYQQCADKVNPGKAAVKQLAPVLKPVCGTLNMDCGIFEGPAADEVNAQLASEVPLLSLLPCSCAAASSGLGVEKIATLLKDAKKCGATVEQVAEAFSDAAVGVYDVAGDAVELGGDAAAAAIKLGESILDGIGSVGCAISKLWGGCGDSPPPTAITVGTAICKPRQGLWQLSTASNATNDFNLSCNDGLRCQAKPGKPMMCMQGMSKVQSEKAEADKAIADAALREANPQACLNRGGELKKGYDLRCRDAQCKSATFFVAAELASTCTKQSNIFPISAEKWSIDSENPFIVKFENVITESIRRDPNTTPVDLLATYDCRPFLGRSEQSLCESNAGYQVCRKLVDQGKMQKCRLAGGGEYPMLAISPAVLGALSKADVTRIPPATAPDTAPAALTEATPAIIANGPLLRAAPAASETQNAAIAVSDAFLANAAQKGCRPFLGRRDELLCDDRAGYDECVQAVNRRLITQCRNADTGEIYPGQAQRP